MSAGTTQTSEIYGPALSDDVTVAMGFKIKKTLESLVQVLPTRNLQKQWQIHERLENKNEHA